MNRLIPLLLLAASCSTPASPLTPVQKEPEKKKVDEPREKNLAPRLDLSFIQANLRLVLLGDGWALEATGGKGTLWGGPYPKEISFIADEAWFYRIGPQDERRFRPSAGPVNPFAAARDQLPRDPVGGLQIKIVARSATSAEVSISGFAAGADTFTATTVKLDVRGPNP